MNASLFSASLPLLSFWKECIIFTYLSLDGETDFFLRLCLKVWVDHVSITGIQLVGLENSYILISLAGFTFSVESVNQ